MSKRKKVRGGTLEVPPTLVSQEFKIIYPQEIYDKIMYWVNRSILEVSGFCTVETNGPTIKVLDAFLLDEGSSAETTISATKCAELDERLEREGRPGALKLWWHSHVNMGVFWSGTDRQAMNELSQHGWFSYTVFNKRYEHKSAVGLNQPFRLLLDDVKTEVFRILPDAMTAPWEQEYQANKRTEPEPRTYYDNPYERYHSYSRGQRHDETLEQYWDRLAREANATSDTPLLTEPRTLEIVKDAPSTEPTRDDIKRIYDTMTEIEVYRDYNDMVMDGMSVAEVEEIMGKDNVKRARKVLQERQQATGGFNGH